MKHPNGDCSLSATPVMGQEGDNADYSKYTPGGKVELYINAGTKAVEFFEQGKEYYVDFTPAS
ncbi:MAG: hypothetical protein V4617_15065 [Gemmatimonadota bacterium]